MAWRICIWTEYLVDKLATREIRPEDFEDVVSHPLEEGITEKTGLPFAKGFSSDGRLLFCIYTELDDVYVQPVTAFEIDF